ncbi:DUF4192 domain-containing protein [Streptomyces sclerotialus]|uniref:DUF4192 domain-containing protein n=1 Tax=Streptomyces sclerotialus TaxID=1957 RepID=UPI00068C0BD3
MTHHIEPANPADPRPTTSRNTPETRVTLRGPAELADALPYLLGFYPDDSVVLVALHGDRGRFGGRVRLGIPTDTGQWPYIADQLADCLITSGRERGTPPSGIIAFLCQDPSTAETGREVRDRLEPLAQRLRIACGSRDVPVMEALCISHGHFWSYVCPDERCCPAAGTPLAVPGTSVMAAAAAYSGVQVRGSLKEIEARLSPLTGSRAVDQVKALDAAAAALVPRMLSTQDPQTVREETLALLTRALHTFRDDPPSGSHRAKDACDDALLSHGEAAEMILGLQDRLTRDRAAAWMEGPDAAPALRLWRALARRCPDAYETHAAAPLTLAGWVSWATGDAASARVALCRALTLDPDYLFAQLLHRGLDEDLDPEKLRRCLRATARPAASAATPGADTIPGTDSISGAGTAPEPEQATSRTSDTPADLPTTADDESGSGTTAPRTGRTPFRRPRLDRPAGPRARTRPAARPHTGRPHPRTGPTGGRRDDRSPR